MEGKVTVFLPSHFPFLHFLFPCPDSHNSRYSRFPSSALFIEDFHQPIAIRFAIDPLRGDQHLRTPWINYHHPLVIYLDRKRF